MTRGGRRALEDEETGPERRCVVSGVSGPKDLMIRFVLSPDGLVTPDLAERLPGRGVWASARRDAVETARRKNLFARSLKASARAPEDLAATVESLLVRRLVDSLGLARKAGSAVAGFEKTREAAEKGRLAALFAAFDGAEGGKAKLRPLAGSAPVFSCLSSDELGLAFGRDLVIHAALETGGAADRAIRDARRLQGFRAEAPEETPSLDT